MGEKLVYRDKYMWCVNCLLWWYSTNYHL